MTPGQKLRAVLEERDLDQIEAADRLGVTRQTINNIVNDRQPISRDMANRLARLTGRMPGYWLQSEFPDQEDGDGAPGQPQTGAQVLVDHQIMQAIDDGVIGIEPFDPAQVQAASIDLRLGDRVIPAGGDEEVIAPGKPFRLYPGQTVNLETREIVRFPANHLGRVGPMTQSARFGIIMAHGFQIDPSYEGRLQFCLFNAGRSVYELASGEPVISLEITRLGATPSGGRLARERDRDEVQSSFDPAGACLTIIRQWLEPYVETAPHDGRITARIADLGIALTAATKEKALRAAVTTALAEFHSSTASTELAALRRSYEGFFARHAPQLYLDSIKITTIARALDLNIVRDVVLMRDGAHLTLPQDGAEIDFDTLAAKLGRSPGALVLALTKPASSVMADSMTPFPAARSSRQS